MVCYCELGLFFLVVSVAIFILLIPKLDVVPEANLNKSGAPECCVSCISFPVFEGWLERQPFF